MSIGSFSSVSSVGAIAANEIYTPVQQIDSVSRGLTQDQRASKQQTPLNTFDSAQNQPTGNGQRGSIVNLLV